jgi:hypothetical protein
MPCIIRQAKSMAVAGVKGIPRERMGTKAVLEAALLADSGLATPSMAPLPSSSLYSLITTFP